jgi:hypothetical protein
MGYIFINITMTSVEPLYLYVTAYMKSFIRGPLHLQEETILAIQITRFNLTN